MQEHSYNVSVKWNGNTGQGTKDYRSYERNLIISGKDKPDILGTSDPAFRGDPKKWNPEELLLASLSSCHMLWYLHICSVNKIVVTEYVDSPIGILALEPTGEGYFKEATLKPTIVITDPSRIQDAERLHPEAHKKCFIAQSLKFPVKVIPIISSK